MQTQAVTGSHDSKEPIQSAGGHLSVCGGNNIHTQDFIFGSRHQFTFGANSRALTSASFFTLSDVIPLIQAGVACYQTYRINSITTSWFWAGWTPLKPADGAGDSGENTLHTLPGDIILYVAPYSRTRYESGTANQTIPARALPGCQAKYFPYRTYANQFYVNKAAFTTGGNPDVALDFDSGWNQRSNLLTHQTQAQFLEITNDNPQYAVGTLGGTQNSSLPDGNVYSNGPLGIQTREGTDNTQWNAFIFEIHNVQGVSVPTVTNWYWISKVNLTFEGTRWEASVLSLHLPPLQHDDLGSKPLGEQAEIPTPKPYSTVLYDFSSRPRRALCRPSSSRVRLPEVCPNGRVVSPTTSETCEDQNDLPGGRLYVNWLIKQKVSYVGGERGIHGAFGYKGLQLPSSMKLSGNL